MIILAIDPGSKLGYALFEIDDADQLHLYKWGQFNTETGREMTRRIIGLENDIEKLFIDHHPDIVVIEDVRPMRQMQWTAYHWMHTTFYAADKQVYVRGVSATYPLPRKWKADLLNAPKGVAPKSESVRYANERFDLMLKLKDHDTAEAICMGCWWFEFEYKGGRRDAV